MIIILIGIIVGGVILFYHNRYEDDKLGDFFNFLVGGIIGGFICFFLSAMIPMDTYDKVTSVNIVALQDNNSFNGDFFLGTGNIEGRMEYILYYEESDYYKMLQLPHGLVKIRYTSSQPKLITIENYPTDSFINSFVFDGDIYDKRYIIEVPEGTIKNDYNLDVQ